MVKARLHGRTDAETIVLILIPEIREVNAFALRLHAERKPWHGEAFGWSAEYNPEGKEAPLDSRMTFTPADFSIGESGIWFYSLMWEHGPDQEPTEYLDDRNIVR